MIELLQIENAHTLQMLLYLRVFSHIVFTVLLGHYLILNLQWYNYKLSRVIFKHHKKRWHILIFLLPFVAYFFTMDFFWVFFYFTYIPLFYRWNKQLDKGLVFTQRVWRFFGYLLASSVFVHLLAFYWQITSPQHLSLLALAMSVVCMNLNEQIILAKYKKQAKAKLSSMQGLQIIQITASFGKTSIKNFTHELLKKQFNTYATPQSVNTLNGIIKDINNNLPANTQIYIAESGAREKNDILQITKLLEPHYVVLGKIGTAHLEYFKTQENITNTKLEIIQSSRIKKAYIHKDNIFNEAQKGQILPLSPIYYPNNLQIKEASLYGTDFSLELEGIQEAFSTPLLGSFNPENISVALLLAKEFGVATPSLHTSVQNLSFVPHRLQKIQNGDKLIIDDSFNANFEGMSEAIRLCSSYKGRKIIVTCGLIESSEEENIALAQKIDAVFQIVVITGERNKELLSTHIIKAQKFILEDKSKMEQFLSTLTQSSDMILFANDAPSHI